MAVVKANYVRKGTAERVTAKANIRYIQERPGRDKEKLTRPLFDSAGLIGRHESYQFIDAEAEKGRYFYRFKLSPDPAKEDNKRDLPMQKLTRQMMLRLEKRLKTAIPWAGALHDDHTDKRHVHILAALPRRLRTFELEALIKEATALCREQRRELDYGKERIDRRDGVRHKRTTYQTVKFGNRLYLSADRQATKSSFTHGSSSAPKVHACTCPKCHFSQSHDGRGFHNCVSCGRVLHKKREPELQRKGRVWDRSL
jgi:hypothetical protein